MEWEHVVALISSMTAMIGTLIVMIRAIKYEPRQLNAAVKQTDAEASKNFADAGSTAAKEWRECMDEVSTLKEVNEKLIQGIKLLQQQIIDLGHTPRVSVNDILKGLQND